MRARVEIAVADRSNRRPFFFLSAFSFAAFNCFAQPAIEPYLATIKEVDFRKIEEFPALQSRGPGRFSIKVLQEYGLLSYSRWKVRPEGKSGVNPFQATVMEVYELQDSPGAFGIFTLWDAPGESLDLPVENSYQNRELLFWRGSFVFHLSGSSREQLRDLSHLLLGAIPLINIYPLTVVHLPQEGLIRHSIRFYVGEVSFAQSPNFPRSLLNRLGFEDPIEVATARYSPEGHFLFLIGYPTTALAADHFVKLQNGLQEHFSPQGIYMKKVGVLVGIFLGPEAEAHRILGEIDYSPGVKWVYEKQLGPEELEKKRGKLVNFLGLVRQAFIGTALFILFTLGCGLLSGAIRYQVIRRYPHIHAQEELVQLRLLDNKKTERLTEKS